MPLIPFRSELKKDVAGGGFIVPKRPTIYGPGVIVLLALFGLSFVFYATFYSFREKINEDTQLLLKETSDLERSRDKELEAKIIAFEKRVNVLSELLRSHRYLSGAFTLLEEVTLPTVSYESFSFAAQAAPGATSQESKQREFRVELSGFAPTLLDVARQMIAYTEEPRIIESQVSNYSLGDKGVSFSATLAFASPVILANSEPAAGR